MGNGDGRSGSLKIEGPGGKQITSESAESEGKEGAWDDGGEEEGVI